VQSVLFLHVPARFHAGIMPAQYTGLLISP